MSATAAPVHRVTTEPVPPSEPMGHRATCTCGLSVLSTSGPVVARQLVEAKHVTRAIKRTTGAA